MRIIFLLFSVLAAGTPTFSQHKFLSAFDVSLQLGVRDDKVQTYSHDTHIDFVNYFSNVYQLDYLMAGLQTELVFYDKVALKASAHSDAGRGTYDFQLGYIFKNNILVSLGYSVQGVTIEEYDLYHFQQDHQLIASSDLNSKYLFTSKQGFSSTLAYKIHRKRLQYYFYLNLGLSGIPPFTDFFSQKEPYGNYRRLIIYETLDYKTIYAQPGFQFQWDITKPNNNDFGFILHGSYYLSTVKIPYLQKEYQWISASVQTTHVVPQKHSFQGLSLHAGLFYALNRNNTNTPEN